METIGLGAGSYPDAPQEKEVKTVKVECSFITYVSIPEDCEDKEQYIKENCDKYDLLEEADTINVENVF